MDGNCKKTHDLERLFKLAIENNPALESLASAAILLNIYITAGRYPDAFGLEDITQQQAQQALAAAEVIRTAVLQQLNS